MGPPYRIALALVTAGCALSHQRPDEEPDAGHREPVAWDAGPRSPEAQPPPGVPVCAGTVCRDDEECCRIDGRCVLIGDPSCAVPEGVSMAYGCAKPSDCPDDHFCDEFHDARGGPVCYGGPGRCWPIERDCAIYGREGVCGCDGRTYPNTCEAGQAGVSVIAYRPCGAPLTSLSQMCDPADGCFEPNQHCDPATMFCVQEQPLIVCGIDAQCPEGQLCCPYTGVCYAEDRPLSCRPFGDDEGLPCTDDSDCERHDGSFWSSSAPQNFCAGPGCGPGGVCVRVRGACSGVGDAVCGCDGYTYANECEANRARVRVEHEGSCGS